MRSPECAPEDAAARQSGPPDDRFEFANLGHLPLLPRERHVDEEKGFDIIDVLEEVGQAHNASIAQAALNWLLQKPGVTSVLVGARREEQLVDNLKAASWTMTPEEVQRLDEVSAVPPVYPYWHQQRNNARFQKA